MGPPDQLLIACNEVGSNWAIVGFNKRQNNWLDWSAARLTDHTDTEVWKFLWAVGVSTWRWVGVFSLLHAFGPESCWVETERDQRMSIWRSTSFNEHSWCNHYSHRKIMKDLPAEFIFHQSWRNLHFPQAKINYLYTICHLKSTLPADRLTVNLFICLERVQIPPLW